MVAFCRSLREAGTASELSGMVTAHFEWSICFCKPKHKACQITLQIHTSLMITMLTLY